MPATIARTAEEIEADWNARAQLIAAQADYDVSHLQYRLSRYQFGSLANNYEAADMRAVLYRALSIAIHRAEQPVLQAAE